jgi:hypothetical protein
LAGRSSLAFPALLFTIGLTACGPRSLALPTGAGTPAADFSSAYAAARSECESVRTIRAELGLSGRAAGQRMGGRVLSGLVPGALRLEGVAPFGAPVFILVADGPQGTLLLTRDRRVVREAAVEDNLNALIGVRLRADDLRALLSGCVKTAADPASARAYGADWMAVELASGGTIYLNRRAGVWRIVAGRYGGLEVDYTEFEGSRPSRMTLRGADLNLGLALTQVELNSELPRDQLVALKIPEGVTPLSLEELRKAGPVGR